MKRLLRALGHGLQRLGALLLAYAGAQPALPRAAPDRGDGSPPTDWLGRVQRRPPRDWIERIRRGRPHWMEGTTPADAEPSTPRRSAPTPSRPLPSAPAGRRTEPGTRPPAGAPTGGVLDAPGGRGWLPDEPGAGRPAPPSPADPRRAADAPANPPPAAASGRAAAASVPPAPRAPALGLTGPTPPHDRLESPHPAGDQGEPAGNQGEPAGVRRPGPPGRRGWFDRIRRPPGRAAEESVSEAAPAQLRIHDDAPTTTLRPPAGPSWEADPAPAWNRPALEADREQAWAGEGGALAVLEPAPRLDAVPHLSVVAPRAPAERQQAIYEIQEIPAEAGSRPPWPDLPGDPPADPPDPTSIWRRWARRERLAREQRGD